MDKSCPDYTKLDGEFEDNTPFECGEYQDPYADDDEPRQVMCASELLSQRDKALDT